MELRYDVIILQCIDDDKSIEWITRLIVDNWIHDLWGHSCVFSYLWNYYCILMTYCLMSHHQAKEKWFRLEKEKKRKKNWRKMISVRKKKVEEKWFCLDMKDKFWRKWFQWVHGPSMAPMSPGLIISANMYHRTNMQYDYLTLHCVACISWHSNSFLILKCGISY